MVRLIPALHYAVYLGDPARVRAILATGVDVDMQTDSGGDTALQFAADEGQTACLEALLAAGASMNPAVVFLSPPHKASSNGHAACVRALIAAGADVNLGLSVNDSTPFSYALFQGHRRVLKILLRAGAVVDAEDIGLSRGLIDNADACELVDAIQKVGGWPQYVHRRRATCASVVKKATWNKLPEAINLEIAAFIEPPGGY